MPWLELERRGWRQQSSVCSLTHRPTQQTLVGGRLQSWGVLLLRLWRPHVNMGGVGIKRIRVGAAESGLGVGWGRTNNG